MVAAPAFAKSFAEAGVSMLSRLRDSGVNVQVMVTKDWDFKKIADVGRLGFGMACLAEASS